MHQKYQLVEEKRFASREVTRGTLTGGVLVLLGADERPKRRSSGDTNC